MGRATFYRHADSPAALLADALRGELDAIRAGVVALARDQGSLRRDDLRETLGQVAEHVIAHQAIYRRALVAGQMPEVSQMLIEHLVESVRWCLGELPALPAGDSLWREVTASGTAHLIVGVLGPWLAHETALESRSFLRLFATIEPRWWDATAPASRPSPRRVASRTKER